MTREQSRIGKTWERVRSEPKLGRNVLTLAVLVLLGLSVGGYIISRQGAGTTTWPWEDRFVMRAEFDNAPAVSPGNGQEVRIAGVKVGQIDSASVSDGGKALLTLSIDPRYKVYDNARTVLRPKSPLNEMYVEIDPGGPPGKEIPPDGVLPASHSQRPIQVDEVLGHLDGNTLNALTSLVNESDAALAHAPQSLAGGLSATDRVATDLKPVVTALQTRKDTLAALVTALARISASVGGNDARLAGLAKSLQETLGAAADQSGPLNASLAQLPDLTKQLNEATSSVAGLSDQLDPTLDNLRRASGELPGSLSKLTAAVDRAGGLVDQARPVVAKAKPVVEDLRPLVGDLNGALPDLHEVTGRLNPITAAILPYLNDLDAFVYQTNSLTSLHDANGGILRGLLEVTPSSLGIPGVGPLSGQTPR
ncbi:MlaD family protein [Amycolatopsis sp. SID8362]|uniref:MlaD family protein n=1 Tax=Amycolatopsis sp. SID8362 TaxID=2690346 RepID=UPI00136BFA1C|nr:MlaD family protein [Amycolatopsis sp. SID8362]NBH07485.1 MCE family protein [Amycolatopsis sp. SID8362]NED44181.1 MCE family protein [Amycolatopsis sp. SID8362]